ncbi:DoxX family protein [Pseudonocardia hispaniensis]|uniref:DoxX family protein n=1 Tax=Pseudonocardia hispaniensis TaxID=904933 RepID=A0ABW1IYQ9_9PSEU
MTRSLPGLSRDIALLIARVALAVIMAAHAWQKLFVTGISDTAVLFHKFGIPLAILAASFTIVVEFAASALLVIGWQVPVAGSFLVFVMVGAIVFVHGSKGIFVSDGGWELVGVIIAATLGLMATGPGRISLDHLLASNRVREAALIRRPVTV